MSQTAIITGSGSGIGRAAAIALSRRGWSVVLTGRDARKLEQTAGAMGDARRLVHAADLTVAGAADELVTRAVDAFGRVDAVANVAGFAALASITQTTDALWHTTLDTNLTAAFRLTRAAWPVFERQRGGVVVNVSSMASVDPFPGFVAYAAAKAAVNMLTLVTAREGAAIGVRAVAIAPGAVETPMLRSLFDERAIPRGQATDPAVLGELIADCITGARSFQPGEVILPGHF